MITIRSLVVRAERVATLRPQPRAFRKGRRCKTCRGRISVYNSGAYCWRHQPLPSPSPDARRKAS